MVPPGPSVAAVHGPGGPSMAAAPGRGSGRGDRLWGTIGSVTELFGYPVMSVVCAPSVNSFKSKLDNRLLLVSRGPQL